MNRDQTGPPTTTHAPAPGRRFAFAAADLALCAAATWLLLQWMGADFITAKWAGIALTGVSLAGVAAAARSWITGSPIGPQRRLWFWHGAITTLAVAVYWMCESSIIYSRDYPASYDIAMLLIVTCFVVAVSSIAIAIAATYRAIQHLPNRFDELFPLIFCATHPVAIALCVWHNWQYGL